MEPQTQTGLAGCFVRVIWTLIGPAFITLTAVKIAMHRPAVGSTPDLFFAGILGVSLAARILDRGSAPNAQESQGSVEVGGGSPVTYVIGMTAYGAALYALAHFVAPKVF